jgi:hypothetical protein
MRHALSISRIVAAPGNGRFQESLLLRQSAPSHVIVDPSSDCYIVAVNKRFLFLDSNILLHYKFFTEIDWRKMAAADTVELLIPCTVTGTLDKKKYDSADSVVKERARKVIDRFLTHEDGSPVQKNVTLSLLDHEPDTDFAQHGLSRESEDDRIIAEILLYREAYPDRQLSVVSADAGMTLKCKRRNIPLLAIPEDCRLADRLDAYSKQIRQLQSRVAELENAQPILRLTFPAGNNLMKLKLSPPRLFSDSEIQRRLREKQEELAASEPRPYYASAINYRLIEQAEAKEILAAYESYMKKHNEYATRMAKVIDLPFVLRNEGNASAEDTDVYIYIDGKYIVVDKNDLPKTPKTPAQQKRDSFREAVQGLVRPTEFIEKSNVTGPTITRTPREQIVRFHIERLKQGTRAVLNSICVDFSAAPEIESFGLRYSLNSHSLPKNAEGELHVVIEAP